MLITNLFYYSVLLFYLIIHYKYITIIVLFRNVTGVAAHEECFLFQLAC